MSTMLICLIFSWRMSLRAAGYRGTLDQPWTGGPSIREWHTKWASRYFSVFGQGSSSARSSRLAEREQKSCSSHLGIGRKLTWGFVSTFPPFKMTDVAPQKDALDILRTEGKKNKNLKRHSKIIIKQNNISAQQRAHIPHQTRIKTINLNEDEN